MFNLLLYVLFHRPWSRIQIVVVSLLSTLLGLASPFFQKEFIDTLSHNPTLFNWQNYSPFFLLLSAFICTLLSLSLAQLTNFLGAKESIIMQGNLAKKLYSKTIELRSETLGKKSVGEIVSTYATDVPSATVLLDQSLPTFASIIFPLILAPIALAVLFQIPIWPLMIVFFAISLLNIFLAYRQSKFFYLFKSIAADRIGLVAEWIQNIKTLRVLGWTRKFESKIFETRILETQNRLRMLTNGQTMNSISSTITFLLNILVLALVVDQFEGQLTSGSALAVLWIVAVFLTRPFRQMPWLFTFIFDSWTSLKRIHEFLVLKNTQSTIRGDQFVKIQPSTPSAPMIQIRNLNLTIGENEILKNINMEIQKGEFVAIVGEVGAGKSMLLLSLLGETSAKFDEYLIDGSSTQHMPLEQLRQYFSFAPQEGFIISANLRQNVAFDYDFADEQDDKIKKSLELAQFSTDLERFARGLNLEIGERGVNLSGGQKQRISLARVDFCPSPVVLLDDSLSAIDNDTETKLLASLFKSAWSNRTRILVTHRLTILDEVDRIFFLENGKLVAEGKFIDLLKSNEKFRTFAATVAKEADINNISNPDPELNSLKGGSNSDL
jgi:ATP-binding cassette subfamily B multidrug efflux pump